VNQKKCVLGQSWLLFFILFGVMLFASSCRAQNDVPDIVLADGSNIPAVSALAWIKTEGSFGCEDSRGVKRFASLSNDGLIRIWDVFSGRMLAAYSVEMKEMFSFTESGKPLYSPDGTKKLLIHDDGGIRLLGAGGGRELARYYGFDLGYDRCEWISLVPDGYFNASYKGASFLVVKSANQSLRLDKLSGALFRPDLFRARLLAEQSSGGKTGNQETLRTLTGRNSAPPIVSLSLDDEQRLKISITAQNGGAGLISLHRRCPVNMEEIPAGLFDAKPEILLSLGAGEFGVSAFNKANTVESERVWIHIPYPAVSFESPPVLKALIAAGDSSYREPAAALGELLSLQAGLELYSAVNVNTLFGDEFSKAAFIKTAGEMLVAANENDILIIYIQGRARADSFGNLLIANGLSAEDILKPVLNASTNSLILFDLLPEAGVDISETSIALETALHRFRRKLGPRAMVAVFGASSPRDSIVHAVMEKLNPDFFGAGLIQNRYIDVTELLTHTKDTLAENGNLFAAFNPRENFEITDRFAKAGELRFQTMTSGMLRIDRVDSSPIPLNFGQAMNRFLPPGSYIVEMFYRNGHRETRFVELRERDSTWVVFNYTVPLLVGDFSRLRALSGMRGIHIAELNPANYQRVDREVMEAMGMAPFYVAFLAGENFYRAGDYARAISEYSRSISLRPDYAYAFISRGNAFRRMGNFSRAIEDYTRAINLRREYAELFNYRGFVFAVTGDLRRAIADYTQAIRIKPDYTDAIFNRAFAHALLGNWDSAIADYTHVIRLEPSNAIAFHERGLARLNRGERALADADFDAAERLSRR